MMSIEKLIAVGRKATGDEAAAAVSLAVLAASQEPGAQRSAPEVSVHCHRSPPMGTLHYVHLFQKSMSIPSEDHSERHHSNSRRVSHTAKMEPFSSQVCGAVPLCLMMTATRTQGCRQSVVMGSIPLVSQSGSLCFEGHRGRHGRRVGRRVSVNRPSPIAGAVLVRRLRGGALPRCWGSYLSASVAVSWMGPAAGWMQRKPGRSDEGRVF